VRSVKGDQRWYWVALALYVLPATRLSAQCPDGSTPPCAANEHRSPPPLLVILPFLNHSGDSADAYLAATLTDDLQASLLRTRAVRLLGPRGARRDAYVVNGGVRRSNPSGGMLLVTYQVEQPRSGEIVTSSRLDWPDANIAQLPDSLAIRILGAIGVKIPATSGKPRLPKVNTSSEVYDLYLRARYQVARRSVPSWTRAVALLHQAIGLDSGFAPTWATLAWALHTGQRLQLVPPGFPKDSLVPWELAAANRAYELDSTSADVWFARATVTEDVDPTTRAASIRALRRAVAIDPLHADAWTRLGVLSEETGDTLEALTAFRRAVEVNPLQLEALAFLGWHFWWQRRYDSAVVWVDSVVATDPTYVVGRSAAAEVALARGQYDAAEAEALASERLATGPEIEGLSVAARVAIARHDTTAARALVSRAQARVDTVAPAMHAAVWLAEAYAALGARTEALWWLERFRPGRDSHFQMHLRLDPPLDPLRGEPRFQALLAETAGR